MQAASSVAVWSYLNVGLSVCLWQLISMRARFFRSRKAFVSVVQVACLFVVCVCACMRACVHACACVHVRVCVCVGMCACVCE